MDDAVMDVERKLVRSMIGRGSCVLTSNDLPLNGNGLMIGENTIVFL
jgi:hypothetical protein